MFGEVGSQFGWERKAARVCVCVLCLPGGTGCLEMMESKSRNEDLSFKAHNNFNIC